jgi:hypothetical protein
MWPYLGPSCPDRLSSKELSVVDVNSWIHNVLDLGVDSNPGASPAPLQEGLASARVSMLGPILAAYTILSSHHAHDLAQGLVDGNSEAWDANLPEDATRQEVNHAFNEKVWT